MSSCIRNTCRNESEITTYIIKGDQVSFMCGVGATILGAICLAGSLYALYTFCPSARGLMDHAWKRLSSEDMTLLQAGTYVTLPILGAGASIGILIHLKKRLAVINATKGCHSVTHLKTLLTPSKSTALRILAFTGLVALSIPIILGVGALFKYLSPLHDWAMGRVISPLTHVLNTTIPMWKGVGFFGAGTLGVTLSALLGKEVIDSLAEKMRIWRLVQRTPIDITAIEPDTTETVNEGE